MASSGMLRRVALVRADVSEELSASFMRLTRIGELGTTLAVTSNRRTLRRNISVLERATRHKILEYGILHNALTTMLPRIILIIIPCYR
jgi:hypothetical protein